MAAVGDQDEALRLLRQCDPKANAGSAGQWPRGRCAVLKAVLRECADGVAATLQDHRAAALGDLLVHLRDFTLAYAAERRHEGGATFHDLLTWARDLLRDRADVRLRAQGRFDRVFVDEFQDTDPLQVEIAWFLTSDPSQATERDWTKLRLIPGKLFIVGEPKQSIYRFRRADIGIYQQVYAQLERATDQVVLSQSFRSPEPMIDGSTTTSPKTCNSLTGRSHTTSHWILARPLRSMRLTQVSAYATSASGSTRRAIAGSPKPRRSRALPARSSPASIHGMWPIKALMVPRAAPATATSAC